MNLEVQPPPPQEMELVDGDLARQFDIAKALLLLCLPHRNEESSPSYHTILNELKHFNVHTLFDLQIKFAIQELDVDIQRRLAKAGNMYHVEKINEILSDLCGLSVDAPYDLNDFVFKENILSTGDPLIDDLLDGGLRCGALTEICGESSCGKTQICLQLLIQCASPHIVGGLNCRSLYITTENYPRTRLEQMIKQRLATLHNYIAKIEQMTFPELQTVEQFLDRILVRDRVIYAIEEFNKVIYEILQQTIQENPVKLIVIDSVAAVYRTSIDQKTVNYQHRAIALWNLSCFLRKLAFENDICIVLVNHVTDRFDQMRMAPRCHLTAGLSVEFDENTYLGIQRDKKPAMGLFWSNMINMRIMLTRKKNCKVYVGNERRGTKKKKLNDKTMVYVYKTQSSHPRKRIEGKEEEEEEEEVEGEMMSNNNNNQVDRGYNHRKFKVVFSPYLKEERSCFFHIDDDGVRGIQVSGYENDISIQ